MTAYRTRGGTMSGQRMPSFSTLICDAKDCERRDERGALRGDSAAVLRRVARERGWARVEGKDYCPEHVCPHGYVPGDHHYESGTCGPDQSGVKPRCDCPERVHHLHRYGCKWAGAVGGVMTIVPNKPKTPLRSIRVSDDLWEKAKVRADEKGETVSDVVRRALERYVR